MFGAIRSFLAHTHCLSEEQRAAVVTAERVLVAPYLEQQQPAPTATATRAAVRLLTFVCRRVKEFLTAWSFANAAVGIWPFNYRGLTSVVVVRRRTL